ncbi:MAG: sulfotransferase [Solirubrobacteraceae bacterium]
MALIVGAARSGTTLLRLILDAHAEIGCPAEAGLPGLMAHMAGVWMTVRADEIGHRGEDPGAASRDGDGEQGGLGVLKDGGTGPRKVLFDELPGDARDWIRESVRTPMRRYTARADKRLYVDKSLDSVFHLELVRELFPEARFVLLFRHVMDTVASGIEASPWGFQAYGYGPYVQASPHNSVAALANYWLAHVTAALAWEEKHQDCCHRLRYEDLVLRPEETVGGVLRFLEVREDLSVLEYAFQRAPARGPGDYKVVHTSQVHARSIGRGKRVPVGMLPPPLLEAVNEKLQILGYGELTSSWNTEERAVDAGGDTLWAGRLSELMSNVQLSAANGAAYAGPLSFALVAEDHRALRWIVDAEAGEVAQGDGEVDAVLTGTAEDLVLMLTGEENLGVLLRSGRIRHLAPSEEEPPMDLPATINLIVGMLQHRPAVSPEPV